MSLRINIGCGQTPTAGWKNYDNSLSLRLAKIPLLQKFLHKLKLLEANQLEFIKFAHENEVEYGDATKGLSVKNGTVDIIYSSHMLEHLDKYEASLFLKEAFRILQPEGIIRIAVPDIDIMVNKYRQSGDADDFIESTHMCISKPRTFAQRVRLLLVGTRNHQWMYDGESLKKLLELHGFARVEVMTAGQTKIRGHEPLDLKERESESVYVEAIKQTE